MAHPINSIGQEAPAECQAAIFQYPQGSTIRKIIDALGGVEKIGQYPLLAWQDRFAEGGTGYIDGVRPQDMAHPIMLGADPWHRPFIAIRTNDGVETLFQRYVDDPSEWTSGNHYLRGREIVISQVDGPAIRLLECLYRGGIAYPDTSRQCSMLEELLDNGMFKEAPEIERAARTILWALQGLSDHGDEIPVPPAETQAALHKLTDLLNEFLQCVEATDSEEYRSIKSLIDTIEHICKGEELGLPVSYTKSLFQARVVEG